MFISDPQKEHYLLQIVGQWSWRLKSAKKCVTTHLPKLVVSKMDGAISALRECIFENKPVVFDGCSQTVMCKMIWKTVLIPTLKMPNEEA